MSDNSNNSNKRSLDDDETEEATTQQAAVKKVKVDSPAADIDAEEQQSAAVHLEDEEDDGPTNPKAIDLDVSTIVPSDNQTTSPYLACFLQHADGSHVVFETPVLTCPFGLGTKTDDTTGERSVFMSAEVPTEGEEGDTDMHKFRKFLDNLDARVAELYMKDPKKWFPKTPKNMLATVMMRTLAFQNETPSAKTGKIYPPKFSVYDSKVKADGSLVNQVEIRDNVTKELVDFNTLIGRRNLNVRVIMQATSVSRNDNARRYGVKTKTIAIEVMPDDSSSGGGFTGAKPTSRFSKF